MKITPKKPDRHARERYIARWYAGLKGKAGLAGDMAYLSEMRVFEELGGKLGINLSSEVADWPDMDECERQAKPGGPFAGFKSIGLIPDGAALAWVARETLQQIDFGKVGELIVEECAKLPTPKPKKRKTKAKRKAVTV